ncbi:uncharacterized protein LOC124717161 isoform X2 [Schistocerca piceifrons]|uniref:uncharacterized protein LOC124717161 isoform X2 n=1 Tax=Schistocerca piceifrons TaxID=274613 RepID=UPI001F5EE520|nr:uncharacterized protein LOC124717161 isoform X2 [Schistocerca piceifrons]
MQNHAHGRSRAEAGRRLVATSFLVLVLSSTVLALPHPHQHALPEARRFAEKSNVLKKVSVDNNELDDVSTNSVQPQEGFSWSNMLSMFMQMLFNPQQGPNKSDSIDTEQGVAPSPWANLLSVGLKILTAILGGGNTAGDGIDKVDNGSPMQFISIVVNLLDALKTSFSQRSMAARSIGKRDSISEAAVAGLALLKGYVRTLKTSDSSCMQRMVCEANQECSADTQGAIYCQLGTYATSFMLERSSDTPFDAFYDAGRRGRSGEDCRALFLSCNEV